MKKACSLLLAVLLLAGLFPAAFAAEDSSYVYLGELGLVTAIPSGMITLTRGMDDNAPALAEVGMTAAEADEMMVNSAMYLNSIAPDFGSELIITMTPMDTESLSGMSSAELKLGGAQIRSEFASIGIDVSDIQTTVIGDIPYYVIHHSQQDGAIRSMQYYTVVNYQAINFTLHSYNGLLSAEQEELLTSVVENSVFNVRFEGRPVLIGELGLALSVPSDFMVLTRGMDDSDPVLGSFGFTAADVDNLLVGPNAYLDCIAPDIGYEIMLVVLPSDTKDLKDMSEFESKLLRSATKKQFTDMGIEFIDSSLVDAGSNRFIKTYTLQELQGTAVNVLQYCTIVGGTAYSMNLQSYTGSITPEMESVLAAAAESLVFFG